MSTITLFAAAANAAMSVGDTFYGIFYFLFMSAVILGAAYFVTRYLARRGFNPVANKNLKVIETVPLGIDKSLLLVKVGEQYLLLGSSQKNITLLAAIERKSWQTAVQTIYMTIWTGKVLIHT
jgi:flagellar biosynthetic protein FliO